MKIDKFLIVNFWTERFEIKSEIETALCWQELVGQCPVQFNIPESLVKKTEMPEKKNEKKEKKKAGKMKAKKGGK